MLGVARIAEKGLLPAVCITAAFAFLGVLSFDMSVIFGLLVTPIAVMLSAAVVAFVLLRHQEQPAITTTLAAGVIVLVASLLMQQNATQVLVFTALCWASTIGVASVLRNTVSLKWAVLSTVPAAVLVAIVAHAFKAELVHFWQFAMLDSLSGLSDVELQRLGEDKLTLMRDVMPVLLAESVASWAFFVILCAVFIARYWQAQLFNPGGFQKEFHSLRLGREAVLVFVVTFAVARLGAGSLMASIASAMMFVFFIQGLSVLHCLTKQRGLSKGWLTGMYAILWLPPTMLALSVLGIADNVFRLRKI